MQIKDELARVEGVADIILFGERDYSMRIWIDPLKLAVRNLTADDVVRAIREQNQQVATGMIGAPPTDNGQNFQITLSTLGRLKDPEQFADIILARRRTETQSAFAMSAALSWARRVPMSTSLSTASRPCSWRSFNCPMPMR